jgi:integrase
MARTTRRGHGDGSIYQRRDGRWAASISLEGGKRKTFYGKTRKEVQEQLKKAQHEQLQGTLVTTPQQKVEQFLTHWLEDAHKQSIRLRTYERYEEILRLHLIPGIGHHPLQKLTPQHLQAFYKQKLEEGLSSTTVASFHNVLHKALETAVRWNLVARNVCSLVTPPRRRHYEIQPLSIEQVKRLQSVIHDHRMEALFLLALGTGMRRAELMGLKWQDLDFALGTLQVRRILTRVPTKARAGQGPSYVETEPKTDRGRRCLFLPSFVLEALKRHRVHQLEEKQKAGPAWQDHDYVFCTSIGTHLNPTRDMLDQLKALLEKAELPDVRFHDLRHSAATALLALDTNPKIVQEVLGHSAISVTMDIYSHVLPTMQKEAMSKLNDALQG